MLPEAQQHHKAGVSLNGSREASGLLLRGVIMAVYTPAQYAGPPRDGVIPSYTCDIAVYSSRHRVPLLRWVPLAVQSGGVDDHEVWKPNATTGTVSGAPLTSTTPAEDMNGDHVLVGFLNGDLALPVILDQLPHPRTKHRPVDPSIRYERTLADSKLTVGEDGTITVVPATKLIVTNPLDATPTEALVMGESFLPDLQAFITEVQAFMAAFGVPSTNAVALLAQIQASLTASRPYLTTKIEAD